MDRFIDIKLLPDPEFPATTLMNALYAKLHKALSATQQNELGVSFPRSEKETALGSVLRLHGDADTLAHFMATNWLTGMRDHVHVSDIEQVPASCEHRCVRRVQVKSNPDRIRRRQMRRHGWTETEAREKIPDDVAKTLKLPFATFASTSSGQRFRLFIDHGQPQTIPSRGTFSSYGLSKGATVPWF